MAKTAIILALIIGLSSTHAYSKYGRSCKDIGCPSNQVCVMVEDPCTIYSRDECGKYPTCKKVSDASSTCQTFVCPPTQSCKMDGGVPKCFEDHSLTGGRQNSQTVQNINPGSPIGETPSAPVLPSHNNNYPNQNNYPQNPYPQNPSYPANQNPNAGIYPHLPGQTTQRPNVYQPGQHVNTGGYPGGSIGSGYPGQGGGYPVQTGGYPGQGGGYPKQSGGYPGQGSGYPGQGGGYPGQGGGYPGQGGGYPGQGSGYPGQGGRYPGQGSGYPGQGSGYPGQGGGYPGQGSGYPGQSGKYPSGQNNGYGQSNYNQGNRGHKGNKPSGQESSNPIFDKITNTLKTLGLFWFLLKFVISRVNGIYS